MSLLRSSSAVSRRRRAPRRRGAILVLFAIALIVILAILAFALDIGSIAVRKTELQAAADAAALAGASLLDDGPSAVEQEVIRYLTSNGIDMNRTDVGVEAGKWDRVFHVFRPIEHDTANTIRVSLHLKPLPSFFGRIFQASSYSAEAHSTAVMRGLPRDIVLLLDLTESLKEGNKLVALRKGLAHFIDVIDELHGDDKVAVMGLSTAPIVEGKPREDSFGIPYTYHTNEPDLKQLISGYCSVVEAELTNKYDDLRQGALSDKQIVAGKYGEGSEAESLGTGSGVRDAVHLLANDPGARDGVDKIVILVSDGLPNRPQGWAFYYLMNMAKVAGGRNVRVHTISLNDNEDLLKTMKGVAYLTKGRCLTALSQDEETLVGQLQMAFEIAAYGERRAVLVQ